LASWWSSRPRAKIRSIGDVGAQQAASTPVGEPSIETRCAKVRAPSRQVRSPDAPDRSIGCHADTSGLIGAIDHPGSNDSSRGLTRSRDLPGHRPRRAVGVAAIVGALVGKAAIHDVRIRAAD
jgi:hypothetical protein